MKKILSIILATILIVTQIGVLSTIAEQGETQSFDLETGKINVDMRSYLSKHDLVYKIPPTRSKHSMPIATGKVGAMVWQDNGIKMQVNNVDASPQTQFSSGTISLDLDTTYTQFEQRLNLYDGFMNIKYDTDREISIFGKPQDELIGINIKDSTNKIINLDIKMWDTNQYDSYTNDFPFDCYSKNFDDWKQIETTVTDNMVAISRGSNDLTEKIFGYTLGATVDGANFTTTKVDDKTVRLTITPNGEYTIWIANPSRISADTQTNLGTIEKAESMLANAIGKNSEYITSFKAFWNSFWEKSFIQYEDDSDYLENIYYISKYMFAGGGYGKYPFHFANGVYRSDEDKNRIWTVAYWHWNQRAIYNGLFAANHVDLLDPYYNLYMNNEQKNRADTNIAYPSTIGKNAFMIPETFPWDGTREFIDTSSIVRYIHATNLEITQNLFLKYRYTKDIAFLDSVYEYMKGTAGIFTEYLLAKNEDGKYYIPENMSNAREAYFMVKDPVNDIAAIKYVFPMLIEAATLLNKDADLIMKWQDILDNLVPFYTTDNIKTFYQQNQPQKAREQALQVDGETYLQCDPSTFPSITNYENPELEMIYPFGLTGIGASDYQTALRTFNARRFTTEYAREKLGFGISWDPSGVQAARLGLGDEALDAAKYSVAMSQIFVSGKSTDGNCYYETNGLLISTINESLLQSYNGKIRVFPAVPTYQGFKSKFTLLAEGGFLISSELDDNKNVKYIGVKSQLGGSMTVINPWDSATVRSADGTEITTSQNSEITFETVQNGVYIIEKTDKPFNSFTAIKLSGEQNQTYKELNYKNHRAVLGLAEGAIEELDYIDKNGKYQAEDIFANVENRIGAPAIVSDRIPNGEVSFGGDANSGLKLNMEFPGEGKLKKTLTVTHTKGSLGDMWDYKPLAVYLNGEKIANVVLPYNSWGIYEKYDIPISIDANIVNVLELRGGSSGYDYFEISDRESDVIKAIDLPDRVESPVVSTHGGITDLWLGSEIVNGVAITTNNTGLYNIKMRYIKGFDEGTEWYNKPLTIKLNGQIIKSEILKKTTNDWTGFKTYDFGITLPSGQNELQFLGGSIGIDTFEIIPAPVTIVKANIKLDKNGLSINDTANITVEVEKNNGSTDLSDVDISYQSENPSIATVDNGIITAKSNGAVNIITTLIDASKSVKTYKTKIWVGKRCEAEWADFSGSAAPDTTHPGASNGGYAAYLNNGASVIFNNISGDNITDKVFVLKYAAGDLGASANQTVNVYVNDTKVIDKYKFPITNYWNDYKIVKMDNIISNLNQGANNKIEFKVENGDAAVNIDYFELVSGNDVESMDIRLEKTAILPAPAVDSTKVIITGKRWNGSLFTNQNLVSMNDMLIEYSSDDKKLADVSVDGVVIPREWIGYVKINAKVTDKNGNIYNKTLTLKVGLDFKYEAENSELSGGSHIGSEHTGYSGSGFASVSSGSGLAFYNVEGIDGGKNILEIRYANGFTSGTVGLYINGVHTQITLETTNVWNAYATKRIPIVLEAGRENTIKIVAESTDTVVANIDYIKVQSQKIWDDIDVLLNKKVTYPWDTDSIVEVYAKSGLDIKKVDFSNLKVTNSSEDILTISETGKIAGLKDGVANVGFEFENSGDNILKFIPIFISEFDKQYVVDKVFNIVGDFKTVNNVAKSSKMKIIYKSNDNTDKKISVYINNKKIDSITLPATNGDWRSKIIPVNISVDNSTVEFKIEDGDIGGVEISIIEVIDQLPLLAFNHLSLMNVSRLVENNITELGIGTEYLNSSDIIKTKFKNMLVAYVENNNVFDSVQNLKDKAKEFITSVTTSEDTTDDVIIKGPSGGGGGTISVNDKNKPIPPIENQTDMFDDLSEAQWAREAINYLSENKVISGDGNGKFRPNDSVTREEFVKMIVLAFKIYDENSKSEFADVDNECWAYKYIASASTQGIVKGNEENKFGIGQNITREDMATMIYRAALTNNIVLTSLKDVEYSDEDSISNYAKDAVNKLSNSEIINGMGNGIFSPKTFCTRAMVAKVIYTLHIQKH